MRTYNLHAVIYFTGETPNSGHYVVDSKVGEEWFRFNDDSVSKINLREIITNPIKSPYLIIYKKTFN